MVWLVAAKNGVYGTRRLKAGDAFTADQQYARIWKALGRAVDAVGAGGQVESAPPAADDLPGLRAEYQRVIGKRPFHGWDAATLRAKLTDYRRRDLRAEG